MPRRGNRSTPHAFCHCDRAKPTGKYSTAVPQLPSCALYFQSLNCMRRIGPDHIMLYRWTKKSRIHAALALAVIYAFCVIGSPMALAFAGSTAALPCLTGDHHGVTPVHAHEDTHPSANVHVHHEGMVQHHGDHSAPVQSGDGTHKQRIGACCGLLCFTAVTSDLGIVIGEPVHRSVIPPSLPRSWPLGSGA